MKLTGWLNRPDSLEMSEMNEAQPFSKGAGDSHSIEEAEKNENVKLTFKYTISTFKPNLLKFENSRSSIGRCKSPNQVKMMRNL